MIITFNGTLLAKGWQDGGTDAIAGFDVDSAEQEVQVVKPPRAPDATYIPRGNRQRTIIGSVIPASADSLDDAMEALTTLYDGLPSSGALVVQQGSKVTTWNAVLKNYHKLKDASKGISYGFELTFYSNGPGVSTTV